MTKKPKNGGARERDGHFYANARYGKGKRLEVRVPWATNRSETAARASVIADVAEKLAGVGRRDLVRKTAELVAAASTPARLAKVLKTVDTIVRGAFVGPSHDITFEQWANRYTSGELARTYPDNVKARNHDDDISRLKEYILEHVRDVPVVDFELTHAQLVLSKLPVMSEANRRQVAQIMGRLMHLAVLPGQLIKASPLPRGWLPKVTKRKHFSCLYPKEEAKHLACTEIPEVFRLFCGVLDREGMRLSMLLDSDWWQWGDVGTFTSTKTKTGDPHLVAIRPDTAAAMRLWREKQKKAGKLGEKPFAGVLELVKDRTKIAEYYRASLRAAGITREELFTSTEFTGALRAHDMRATFVTVSLAEGRSETWIRDRTSHKSTAMIDRYRRTARQFAELELGSLVDLIRGLGWWKGGGRGRKSEVSKEELTTREVHGKGLEPSRLSTAEPKFGRRTRGKLSSTENTVDGEGSRRREKALHQSSTTPLGAAHALKSGTGLAQGVAPSEDEDEPSQATVLGARPGVARAVPRHGPATPAEARLVAAMRGATALTLGADVLEAQLRAFDGDDGGSDG